MLACRLKSFREDRDRPLHPHRGDRALADLAASWPQIRVAPLAAACSLKLKLTFCKSKLRRLLAATACVRSAV
ncbi:hypothetical protein [Chamaesiphon sp. VAR_69_metabat_338]|uniref:hypothetical protein n=1 Tax=Chamaesiphon sp. VAR_69_metabat_338 TaxID=2964704 RepID=UPI00286DADE3|nr:hypothetical protein [Chamaesiphon sp. VAR_69_metabat_338]